MQVVVIPDHRAPVVTQMIWYKVGGMDDPAGHSGLAHFFEHMMFRGTKAEPGDSFSRLVAKNGGEDNAFTTEDYTAFYVQIARDRLKLVMGLEADRMAHLDLSDTGVKTERDVVLEERRMRVDNVPASLAAEQVDAALYLSHPYGRPVIGWPDEVHRLGRAEAQDFYDRHYAPNNAILVEVGDVTPEEVKATAAETLAKVPARILDPRTVYAEPARLGETRLAIARPDASVPSFSRSWRVASYSEGRPGQAEALEILAALLGGDANAVLYRTLVVEQKLATDAGASYDGDARNAGAFSVYATPRPRRDAAQARTGDRCDPRRLRPDAARRIGARAYQDPAHRQRCVPPRQPAPARHRLRPGARRRPRRRRRAELVACHPGGRRRRRARGRRRTACPPASPSRSI
ncbi:MAG: pitrilysin family protein [Rhizomicrobium sp.]